ncbi:hypothetical protein JCM3775_000687 [Rhodotorula graminis]
MTTSKKHTLPFVTVDAFTTRPFTGNPASVLVFPLTDDKLQQLAHDDALMQHIAAEFNLSETAYCRELDGGTDDEPRYELRWRTPVAEVPLCGHATLASAYALFSQHHPSASTIRFDTRQSGTLFARRTRSTSSTSTNDDDVGLISLDFPMASILALSDGHRRLPKILAAVEAATGLSAADKVVRCAWFDAYDSPLVEISHDVDLRALDVDAAALGKAGKLVILTQPAPTPASPADADADADIHSRVFAAPLGIDEDPVTGAAHTALAPFWLASGPEARARLPPGPGGARGGGRTLRARQVSPRGGEMVVVLDEDERRVELQGSAVRVMRGEIEL